MRALTTHARTFLLHCQKRCGHRKITIPFGTFSAEPLAEKGQSLTKINYSHRRRDSYVSQYLYHYIQPSLPIVPKALSSLALFTYKSNRLCSFDQIFLTSPKLITYRRNGKSPLDILTAIIGF